MKCVLLVVQALGEKITEIFPVTILCNVDRYVRKIGNKVIVCYNISLLHSPILKIVCVKFEYVFMARKTDIWDLLIAVFLFFRDKANTLLFCLTAGNRKNM